MKKMRTAAVVLLGLTLPVMAQAAEFQTPGALGIGGAGVARNNGALTAYWNPAGGAFNDSPFAMSAGVEIGARGSKGLTENVDRMKDIKFDTVKNISSTSTAANVGDMVKLLSIIDDIDKRGGNLSLTGEAPIGFAIKHVSFGIFGNFEGYAQPQADSKNILPTTTTGGPTTTVNDLYAAAVTSATSSTSSTFSPGGYFSKPQFDGLASQFVESGLKSTPGGFTDIQKANQLVNAIQAQVQNSGLPASTTYDSLLKLSKNMSTAGSANNTFDKNTTSIMTKALMYYEVPLAYGHPFDFGEYGKLGIGASAKVISGTVYQNQIRLVNRGQGSDNISSSDLTKDITKNSKSSVNFGIDLGALYKYDKWLSVGLVAKNLNSPKFDAPEYDATWNDPITDAVVTKKVTGDAVKLKPQLRTGVALDPLSWLTISSDIDLTENDTLAPGTVVGSSVKSQNLGGGVEVHPYSWLRIRGGAYKNLANSDIGTVLTGGFTLAVLDLDAAMATKTFKVGSTNLPQEAKVQLSISFTF